MDNQVNAQTQSYDCSPALFADLTPGFADSSPQNFTELNGSLYFSTLEGLWKTDGTSEGTILINSFSFNTIKHIKILNNELIISTNATPTVQLWKSDGINTTLIKDFPNASGFYGIENLTSANGFVLFTVFEETTRKKLWRTDGTAEGTVLVKDIDPTNSMHYEPHILFEFNDNVYFRAGTSTTGQELWKSDGTSEGTTMVKDLYPGLGAGFTSPVFGILNNELYFNANDGSQYGLWKTDGTEAGTVFIKELSFGIDEITNINDILYLSAGNSQYGTEVWISDGTTAGTYMLKDINPGSASSTGTSYGHYFKSINSKVMFVASDGVHGLEPWVTDGTEAGTQMLKEINTTNYSSEVNHNYAKVFNGYLYFSANNGTTGRELWKTDGTEAGTALVADIFPGSNDSDPNHFTVFNGNLFFSAKTAEAGVELWSCGSALSIPEVELDKGISVYPNPTTGLLNIQFSDNHQEVKLEIYDVNGRKNLQKRVMSISQNNMESLHLDHLTPGIYMLRILTKEQQSTFKIVITR